MGLLETLFGMEDSDKMTQEDIAGDMLKDSKFALNSLIIALSESSNPKVRQVLRKQFNKALEKHFRLSDIAVENDWYHPFMTPEEQLREDSENAQNSMRK